MATPRAPHVISWPLPAPPISCHFYSLAPLMSTHDFFLPSSPHFMATPLPLMSLNDLCLPLSYHLIATLLPLSCHFMATLLALSCHLTATPEALWWHWHLCQFSAIPLPTSCHLPDHPTCPSRHIFFTPPPHHVFSCPPSILPTSSCPLHLAATSYSYPTHFTHMFLDDFNTEHSSHF